MKKQILCIVMSMILLIVSASALAEAPAASPAQPETISASGLLADGTPVGEDGDFAIILTQASEETVTKANENLSATALDTEAYILVELWKISVTGSTIPQTATANFSFVSAYAPDAELLAFVGLVDGEKVEWMPVDAEASEELVKVEFSDGVLQRIVDAEEALFVLYQKK